MAKIGGLSFRHSLVCDTLCITNIFIDEQQNVDYTLSASYSQPFSTSNCLIICK